MTKEEMIFDVAKTVYPLFVKKAEDKHVNEVAQCLRLTPWDNLAKIAASDAVFYAKALVKEFLNE